ncbi:hypothetical protein B9P99_01105 [Candidatus Marsarchaeota G1 archaeon OSP_B]|uniref:Uncharacterized protein n=3 Tax=Candidatus Marsarchaeota group 1 TaxID=2203770 RepID=A0A2R6AK86_9ARCH|nr:MAG: hypothetical protein B9Q02_01105 [Candidatus Marsarchaeota G1 archaeon BE_D]PSN88891.1 MAG: hypothetical protein B9Q00_03820 [Candidatus Marsarchaeota G1 archaeon OSP_C]PSN95381.1 MAG: hypothetical protein B9P99_01105 [Candidatus Marsarchaeota G1 archaeon OSP_B]
MAKKGFLTTVVALVLLVMLIGFELYLYSVTTSLEIYPSLAVLIYSTRYYNEWLAYETTKNFLNQFSYILTNESYIKLLFYIENKLKTNTQILYTLYGYTYLANVTNYVLGYYGLKNYYPLIYISSNIYLQKQGLFLHEKMELEIPVRFSISESLFGKVLSLIHQKDSTQNLYIFLASWIRENPQVNGKLVIKSFNETSYILLQINDCFLFALYNTCPVYLVNQTIFTSLPNLTFSL